MRGHLAAVVLASSCSWIHLDPPSPPRTPTERVDCDPDSVWPFVDATIAIASYTALIGGVTWAFYLEGREHQKTANVLAVSSLVIGLSGYVWAASAKSGERHTYACAKLRGGVR